MAEVAHAVSAEKVVRGVRVLSPRTYAVLTSGTDGAGISMRLEQEVRARARKEWLLTGSEDAMMNWLRAERCMVRTLDMPEPGCDTEWRRAQQPEEAGQELRGDPPVEAELQWLRQKVAALAAELSKPRTPKSEAPPPCELFANAESANVPADPSHSREDPELAKFRESMSRISCLKQELAATDRMLVDRNDEFRKLEMNYDDAKQKLKVQMLVDRNDEFRKLEMNYDDAKQKLKVQADELAQREAEHVAAEAGRMEAEQQCSEAEQRCTEQSSRIEELMQKVSEQDALIQALQHQLLDKDSNEVVQQRASRRKGLKSGIPTSKESSATAGMHARPLIHACRRACLAMGIAPFPGRQDVNAINQKWNHSYTVQAAA
eukprot:CAMPEP_0171163300 /NCGR_PEP_ID=MMETSP0790-20130122/5069_1 /TAXON_ID=2925 /ORGANISM="Alexandrium catenella, Strain OF101" /LENGTH=375 /DNA_ID=CAMNT_0011627995 /DNA_START=71 /DNA_END=1198 /DNA_ORIENTATION=+